MSGAMRPTGRRRLVPAVFGAAFVLYLAAGVFLAVDRQFFIGDALSRVQAAQSVLFSRDPHLSAIGFIFTPLTALAELPLVALSPLWPKLTTDALAAVVMSSAFMAGSTAQLAGIARDRGVPAGMATIVVASYAVNPMIVFYGANGMSEAPYLFCLIWAIRRLARWVDSDDVHDLVVAGVALALGYLTRYDGGAAAVAAMGFVAVVSYRRRSEAPRWARARMRRAVLDAAITGFPSAIAFTVWAVTSWLITGNLFAQFGSQYGNSAIIEQAGGTGSSTPGAALAFSVSEMLIMAPLLPLVLALTVVVRSRRRRLYPLVAAGVVLGAVLAFQTLTYIRGGTFGFLRFYITIIPLASVVALLAVPALRAVPFRRRGAHSDFPPVPEWAGRRGMWRAASTVVATTAVLAVGTTAVGMTSVKYAPQEFALRSVVRPQPEATDPLSLDARRVARSFSTEKALAQYLDALKLPDGSVLCDTVYGFAVVVRSRHPRQFVIPSDEDFATVLNDPAQHGVQYLLAVPNEGRGTSDALNVRYPTLYENGAQIAMLTLEVPNQGADQPDWRVYRVFGG